MDRRVHNPRKRNNLPLALLVAVLGCGHTHRATDKPDRDTDQKEKSVEKEESVERKSEPAKTSSSSKTSSHESRERSDSKSEKPPLAQAPAGLLQSGAVGTIQDKLAAKGYLKTKAQTGELDSATEEALRIFQRDHHLPATGMPDAETVRLLGLSPDAVFRRGQPSK